MDSTTLQQDVNSQATPSMYVSLNEAAKLWRRNKGNLSKIVAVSAKKGEIQWHEQPGGQKKLFVPELIARLGNPPEQQETPPNKPVSKTTLQHHETGGDVIEISRLEAELNAAREMIEMIKAERKRETDQLQSQLERERKDAEARIDSERKNADAWRYAAEQANEVIKALPAPANNDSPRKKFLGLF